MFPLRLFVGSVLLLATGFNAARSVEKKITASELERMHQSANARSIHLLMLQQAFEARQRQILAISNIRAKGHETNMRIIDNIRPSGRYEYNPATGRYDRYVP